MFDFDGLIIAGFGDGFGVFGIDGDVGRLAVDFAVVDDQLDAVAAFTVDADLALDTSTVTELGGAGRGFFEQLPAVT
ncbi:hypothetical protein HC024_05250 [Methylococcaceae bacterium WWC4]|nr:hypothetical protein [Methylococcaceae bacterium WWC4]